MADINSLSFGCGNTLLANQLNIMADAIRSLITLVENIDDQVGSYIPLSGSENITGVLAPDTNEGHNLGKSNKRWGTVWASVGGFKVIDFYDQQTPFGKLGRLEINQDGKLQYDGEPLALLSDINNEINSDNQSFIHFGQNVRGRLDENYVRIPTSLKLDDVDDDEEEAISNNYYNLYCGGINIKGTKFVQRENRRFEEDDGEEHHTLCVRDGELLFDGNPIQLGNVLEGINELDLPKSSKYLYYNYNNLSFEWANGTGTSGGGSIDWGTNSAPNGTLPHIILDGDSKIHANELSGKMLSIYNKDTVNNEYSGLWTITIQNNELCYGNLQITKNNGTELNTSNSPGVSYSSSDKGKYLKVKNDGTGTEWSDISLSDLSNTEIGGSDNALSNGLVLVYDSSSSNWKNASLLANLPPTTGRAAGDYLVLIKDDNGTLKADWTNVTSNITDVIDTGMVDSVNGGTYYRNYKLKTSGNVATGTGIKINTLPPSVDSQDNILTFKNGFVLNGTNGASIIFPNILSTNKISLVNTAASGNTGSGKIAYLEYNGNKINIDTYTSISAQDHETAGTAKLYLNGTEIGTGGSGLTGIKYQNSDSNVTTASSSSGYITLKAGTSNVSFDNTTTGVLKISVSGNSNLTPATDSALGGIKIGYSESNSGSNTNRNYAVKLDNNKAYVNVPWTASGLTSGNWADYLNGLAKGSANAGYLYYDGSNITTSNGSGGLSNITLGSGLVNKNGKSTVALVSGDTIKIGQGLVTKSMLNDNVAQDYLSINNIAGLISVFTDFNNVTVRRDLNNNQTFYLSRSFESNETISEGTYFYVRGTVQITGKNNIVNPVFIMGSDNKPKLLVKNNPVLDYQYVIFNEESNTENSGIMDTMYGYDNLITSLERMAVYSLNYFVKANTFNEGGNGSGISTENMNKIRKIYYVTLAT